MCVLVVFVSKIPDIVVADYAAVMGDGGAVFLHAVGTCMMMMEDNVNGNYSSL